ncbi:ribonuclease H-like domain-containing protein, partial [Tanacetum coccineum]
YNNFKIVEQDVKGTANSRLSSSSQNMAFVSSPRSTNDVNTAYEFNTANTQKIGRKITINESDTARYDKSKVECFNCHKLGHFVRECKGSRNQDSWNRNQDSSRRTINVKETSSKAMLTIDGAGFDWSYMANDEVPTNMALMAFLDSEITDKSRKGVGFVSYNVVPPPYTWLFSPLNLDLSYSGLEEFQQPEFKGYGPKTSKSASKDISNKDHCNYHQRERVVSGNNYTRVNYNYFAKKAHPSSHRNMVPRAVLMKTGLKPLNTARPVTTAHPKTTVYSARPMSHFSKSAQSTIKRPYQTRTTLTNKNFSQKVNTTKGKFYTARQKVVNTARPNSTVVNAVRANHVNDVKASACWVWRPTKLNSHLQKEDQGYVDSRCSRHMTGNMSYLSNLKEFNRGYVTFGGGAKGGKIIGKETLKTGKLDFEESLTCLVAKATLDESMLWHKTLGHVNFKTINKLVKENLVRGLPTKHFENDQTCVACLKGKQYKASCIKKEFSVARTPQQNGVAERRNRTLIEAARTMLADSKLPTTFWAEAVNTACYVQNRVLVVKPHNKTPYELFRGRTPALSFMRPFGCHVTILNTLDYLGKFDGKSDEGFFVGYSLNSKAFRVYNIRTRKVEENLHIRFLEDKPIIAGDGPKWLFDIDVLTKSMNYVPVVAGTNSNDLVDGSLFDSSLKNASNDEPQPSSDAEKKDDEGVNKESGIDDQERPENSTQDVNTAGPSINTASTNVNTGSLNINTVSLTVTTAPLEATHADFFEEELDQESSKRQKTSESSELAKEPRDKKADEMSQEELTQMMIIVLEQGMNVESLQTKYLITNWEIYTEGTRKYWKIIRDGNHTERFNSTEPTDDKEREIWVELKRLFKPDTTDKLAEASMHTL